MGWFNKELISFVKCNTIWRYFLQIFLKLFEIYIFARFNFFPHCKNVHWLFYDIEIMRYLVFDRVNRFNKDWSKFIFWNFIQQIIKHFHSIERSFITLRIGFFFKFILDLFLFNLFHLWYLFLSLSSRMIGIWLLKGTLLRVFGKGCVIFLWELKV